MIEYTVHCSNVSNQCRANITFNPVLFSVHFWNKKTFLFTSQKRIQLMRKKWISWNAKLSFQWAMKRSWKMRIWWVVSLTSFDWPGEPTQKRAVANCVTDDPFTINHVHLPPSHPSCHQLLTHPSIFYPYLFSKLIYAASKNFSLAVKKATYHPNLVIK